MSLYAGDDTHAGDGGFTLCGMGEEQEALICNEEISCNVCLDKVALTVAVGDTVTIRGVYSDEFVVVADKLCDVVVADGRGALWDVNKKCLRLCPKTL